MGCRSGGRAVRRGQALAVLATALIWASVARPQEAAFGPALPLNGNASTDSLDDTAPQIATDGRGRWVAVWDSTDTVGGLLGSDRDVLVSVSGNGVDWSFPAPLNSNAASDGAFDEDEFPHVQTDGSGHWIAVWDSTGTPVPGLGSDRDLLVAHSVDDGESWSAAAPLNTNATTDSGTDRFGRVVPGGGQTWLAVWESSDSLGGAIGTDRDVLVARSLDGGVTWSPPAALNGNADVDFGADLFPEIATDGRGRWVAVWESDDWLGDTLGLDRDILVAWSDDGLTWSPPAALATNAAADTGEDRAPHVATDGSGVWIVVWHSDDPLGGSIGLDTDILVSRSLDGGVTWSAPSPLNSSAPSDSREDVDARLASDGGGNWLAVWASELGLGGLIGRDLDVLTARSTDGGASWSPVQPLTPNASTDAGDDLFPQLAADRAGRWVALWESLDRLGGTIGPDSDILVAAASGLFCGDGDLDPGEDCDDGNAQSGDGCEPDCTSSPDSDGDGVTDPVDRCPHVPDPEQLDADGNGIGDACQCGDVDRDGRTNVADALQIARGEVLSSDPGFRHCDVDGNGTCDVSDALRIARGEVGSEPDDQRCPAWGGS